MDIYEFIASWSGWPPVAAVLVLAIAAIIWMYDRHLKLKDDIIGDLKNKAPDMLLAALKDRLDLANNLLAAEGKDRENAQANLKQALEEIAKLKDEIGKLKTNYNLYASTAESMEAYIGGTITNLPPRKELVKEFPDLKTISVDPALYRQFGRAQPSGVTVNMKKLLASVDKKMDLVSKSTVEHGL
jgi:hypothetical protein